MGIMDAVTGGLTVGIVITAVDKYSKEFTKAATSMSKLKTAALGFGMIAGVALLGVGVASVKLAGDLEQATVAFTTMLGSAEKADTLLKELSAFAAKTPFTIPGIRQNAKQLLAMGIEADNLLPTMKSLGDVASGLSVPMERLALNFGQVKTQGKLTGRELRDFRMAGVPLVQELAKNLNVTEEAIESMVSRAEIRFDDVEAAFRSMSDEGGRFANLSDAQSKTFQGMLSNLQDSFIQVGESIGAQLLPDMKELLQMALDNTDAISMFGTAIGTILVGAMKIAVGVIRGFIAGGLALAWVMGEVVIAAQFLIDLFEYGWADSVERAKYRSEELTSGLQAQAEEMLGTKEVTDELTEADGKLGAKSKEIVPLIKTETEAIKELGGEASKAKEELDAFQGSFAKYAKAVRGRDEAGLSAALAGGEQANKYYASKGAKLVNAQAGFDGTLNQDTNFKAHAGEQVTIKQAGESTNNNVTINVSGAGDPAEVAREIYKKFAALGA